MNARARRRPPASEEGFALIEVVVSAAVLVIVVLGVITIEAAILALNDSFIVDNWRCGSPLEKLTVKGAIAQKFRGPVGTFQTDGDRVSGYAKDYNYDDRLRYRSPPYFLEPVKASWKIVRNNEQVPAAQ
jgi:hypothetical protein